MQRMKRWKLFFTKFIFHLKSSALLKKDILVFHKRCAVKIQIELVVMAWLLGL